jgi:hypothetical protein
MPRKMAGSEMITMEPSIAAISTPIVVLESATHLYRSGRCSGIIVAGAVVSMPTISQRIAAFYERSGGASGFHARRLGSGRRGSDSDPDT